MTAKKRGTRSVVAKTQISAYGPTGYGTGHVMDGRRLKLTKRTYDAAPSLTYYAIDGSEAYHLSLSSSLSIIGNMLEQLVRSNKDVRAGDSIEIEIRLVK